MQPNTGAVPRPALARTALILSLYALFASGAGAQERRGPVAGASLADDVAILREQVAAQQKQIELLRQQVAAQQRMLVRVLQTAGDSAAAGLKQAVEPVSVSIASPPPVNGNAIAPKPPGGMVSGDGRPDAPLAVRIGAADFVAGGFMDFTSVYRSTNVGSGIGTSFGAIPFGNTAAGRMSESRFSAQNSRISLKLTAQPGAQTVTGYVEADFLGVQPTNAYVSSNSMGLRMRQYWASVRRGKWEVLGGQAWSLLTPNRTGVLPLPQDVFYTQDMDTNYQAGLVWSRDPGVRFIYRPDAHWTAAVALENSEQFTGSAVTLPSPFYAGQVNNGGSLSTPNLHPDVIAKVAFDGHAGAHALHIEAAGLARSFRAVRPSMDPATAHGFGGSLNANVEVFKNFRLIANTFLSHGGGRYIYGLGPDLVIRPDGTPSPVRAASAVAGFEYQANPASLFYGYYGGAYFGRNYSTDAAGAFTGFGFPGSSSVANRALQEMTLGYTRTFWKNPKFGALQLITQYSYLTRSPWSVPVGTPSTAHSHMVWTDLRYVLP